MFEEGKYNKSKLKLLLSILDRDVNSIDCTFAKWDKIKRVKVLF